MLDYGAALFCPGTEYGGILSDKWSSTASGIVKWYADTWRGMLDKKIVEPPSGLAYRTVSGDANVVIAQLLDEQFGSLFRVPDVESGIHVNYQIPRYVSLLNALTGMLEKNNAKLKISSVQGEPGESFHVCVEAVPVVNYSEELEYSQDGRINLTIRDYRRGINHLICLGKGELTERTVLHLYVREDGSIGEEKYYENEQERTAVYEYNAADDVTTLRTNGIKRLKQLMNYQDADIDVKNVELEIGDIVSARDRSTGLYVSKPITGKIVRIEGLTETIQYKVKGES